MEGFNLFSETETSSLPLNLAYKAAQLADEAKADLFLYNLRYATIGTQIFLNLIEQVSGGAVKPQKVEKSPDALRNLLKLHPLISSAEIMEAFDFENLAQVEEFILPLVEGGEISTLDFKGGWFIDDSKILG